MIRPWLFEFFPELKIDSGETSAAEVSAYFQRYLELWRRDEELGFEGIFFSEHHFGGSFSPSPNLLIAATAARTSKLRLGVMGIVVPYYTPARILEEIGMLDHLTGGRLEIGTAIGIPQELARLNMSMDEARAINDEALEILDAALTTGVADHRGRYFNYSALPLLPRPTLRPSPPKWTTVVSAGSARRVARRGSKICTGFHPTDQIKVLFDAYRAEAKACGFDVGPEHIALRRRVVIAPTEAEADRMTRSMSERYMRFVSQDSRLHAAPVPDGPERGGGFSVSEDEFISGTPGTVTEQIVDQCRRVGAGHFLAVLHWGAGIDEVSAAHELFGAEVLRALRQAEI
jgi:alkanesulfonate monooxygenase SsuD/methylene tetrahydromethanopterin reductase-like flavin-dependent oxidoreductase (luciferase family)